MFGVLEVDCDLIGSFWLVFDGSLVIWLILVASFEDDFVLLDESGLLLEVDVLLEVLRLLVKISYQNLHQKSFKI